MDGRADNNRRRRGMSEIKENQLCMYVCMYVFAPYLSLHEINDEGGGHHLRNYWKPINHRPPTNRKPFSAVLVAIAEFSERRELSQHLHFSVSASDPQGFSLTPLLHLRPPYHRHGRHWDAQLTQASLPFFYNASLSSRIVLSDLIYSLIVMFPVTSYHRISP